MAGTSNNLRGSSVSDTDFFRTLVEDKGFKNIKDFCDKADIASDPFYKRLKANNLMGAKVDVLAKISKTLELSLDELDILHKLAKSDAAGMIGDISPELKERLALTITGNAGDNSGRIVAPLSLDEAQTVYFLRFIRRYYPEAFTCITTLILTTFARGVPPGELK